jgi:hypothetical protein
VRIFIALNYTGQVVNLKIYTSREVHGKFTSENGCFCRCFWRLFSLDAKDITIKNTDSRK